MAIRPATKQAPAPTEAPARAAVIGDNQPPQSDAEALRARLAEQNGEIIKRKDDLLGAVVRAPAEIVDDATAGKMSDFVLQIGAAYKAAEKVRVAEKEIFLAGTRTVDGFFKAITGPLLDAKDTIERRLTAYQRKKADEERRRREEDARRAREEAERREREAAAAIAAVETDEDLDAAVAAEEEAERKRAEARLAAEDARAKAAELSRTRGDYGAVASLRTTWTYEIEDAAKVPAAFLMVNDAAIKAHIKNRAKDQPPTSIPGVRFVEQQSTVVR